jgi:hypothetical protein
MTKAIPKNWNKTIKTIETSKNPICSAFSFRLNFFIFKENNGISAFKINALKAVMKSNTQ